MHQCESYTDPTTLLSMEVFNADGADHSEQRTLVFGIGVVGHTLIFNITAHPLLRYDGVGLSQNEVHGKAEENGLDSLISKLVCTCTRLGGL
ncbi:hypothetical protein QWA68_002571 [Fusarium oxysporum]|nr:hypothetical protein QWA68_002571 [Fusarium oxysporum]